MAIFLIFVPYGAFAALLLVTSATVSLFAATAICLVAIAYDVIHGRSIKILGAGSAVLFASLGCYLALTGSAWSVSAVKLAIDGGMLAISLGSLAVRFPFSLQYARESVDARTAALPGFLQANYIITWAWSVAILLMLMSNVMMIYVPGLPLWCGLAVALVARNSAVYFTKWYPRYRIAKFAARSTPLRCAIRSPTAADTTGNTTMQNVFAKLAADFFSTIVFLVVYLATDNVLLATGVAIAGSVAQVIYAHVRGRPLGFMTYASLALVIVLGSATLLTKDPRFVLAKPAIAHFAIGAIMLKRGWMLRYMPPIVTETIPEYVTVAGYAWAALMFALGAGTIAIAMTGDLKLWALYVSVIAFGAKIAAFAVQYVVFRILVTSRIRAARA